MPTRTVPVTPTVYLIADAVATVTRTEAYINVLETAETNLEPATQLRIDVLKAAVLEARALAWEQMYSLSQEELRVLGTLI